MKISRRLAIVFTIALIVAASAIVAIIAALPTILDAARGETEINRLLLAKKLRTLKIAGPLKISLWPNLGIELGQSTLSEHASTAVFAKLDSARLSLQWWPLLSRRIVIDAIELDGLKLAVERDKDGRLNIADLLESGPGEKWPFDISSIQLTAGQLTWRDLLLEREISLNDLTLRTGRIASDGAPTQGKLELSGQLHSPHNPQLETKLGITTQYALNLAEPHYAASQLALQLTGHLNNIQADEFDLKIAALEVSGKQAAMTAKINGLTLNAKSAPLALALIVAAPELQLTTNTVHSAALTLTFAADTNEDVALRGRIETPLVADFIARTVTLDGIAAELDIAAPRKFSRPLKFSLRGHVDGNLAQTTASAELNGKLDASKLAMQINITRLTPPAIRFALDIDQLNADDYLKPSPAGSAGKPATKPATKPAAAALPVMPANLDLQGTLKVGNLQASGIKAHQLRLTIATRGGRLTATTEPH